jgi:hypothetical protein
MCRNRGRCARAESLRLPVPMSRLMCRCFSHTTSHITILSANTLPHIAPPPRTRHHTTRHVTTLLHTTAPPSTPHNTPYYCTTAPPHTLVLFVALGLCWSKINSSTTSPPNPRGHHRITTQHHSHHHTVITT